MAIVNYKLILITQSMREQKWTMLKSHFLLSFQGGNDNARVQEFAPMYEDRRGRGRGQGRGRGSDRGRGDFGRGGRGGNFRGRGGSGEGFRHEPRPVMMDAAFEEPVYDRGDYDRGFVERFPVSDGPPPRDFGRFSSPMNDYPEPGKLPVKRCALHRGAGQNSTEIGCTIQNKLVLGRLHNFHRKR